MHRKEPCWISQRFVYRGHLGSATGPGNGAIAPPRCPVLPRFRGSMPIFSILDSRYRIDKNGEELKLIGVTLFDSTSFKCVAYNDVGMTSLTFGLDVRTVPKIEPNHLNEMVVEGETSVFRCFVSGVPTPAISWFHNGKPLEINEEVNSPYKISQAQSCKFGQLSSGFSNGLSAQLRFI